MPRRVRTEAGRRRGRARARFLARNAEPIRLLLIGGGIAIVAAFGARLAVG